MGGAPGCIKAGCSICTNHSLLRDGSFKTTICYYSPYDTFSFNFVRFVRFSDSSSVFRTYTNLYTFSLFIIIHPTTHFLLISFDELVEFPFFGLVVGFSDSWGFRFFRDHSYRYLLYDGSDFFDEIETKRYF